MRWIRHLPVTLVLCAALTVPVACGDDTTGTQVSDLVGTWTLTRFRACDFDSGTGDWGTLTIQSGGAFTFSSFDDDFDEGTISISGSTITIVSTTYDETRTASFSLSGNTLTITSNEDPNCPEIDTFVRD